MSVFSEVAGFLEVCEKLPDASSFSREQVFVVVVVGYFCFLFVCLFVCLSCFCRREKCG